MFLLVRLGRVHNLGSFLKVLLALPVLRSGGPGSSSNDQSSKFSASKSKFVLRFPLDDDDDVYYYIRWRLKLEGETTT